ncbi:EAL domain-containing protein [uncultured Castellaniella sp.]|uniref:bifunctional diguanylate cyclase/phosphodiesterase n=1 Tax=uncultured Castellaniella sp. TaxID=647907 RepID=UPI00262950B7|nr:EAL domain-containing protein [uncultured Castellaniella sp.]
MSAARSRLVFKQWWPGLLVALLGSVVTVALVRHQTQAVRTVAQIRFSEEVRSSTDALAQRIVAIREIVAGVRDLFLIDPDLRRDQFEQVVAGHEVRAHYPELINLSFVRWVRAADLPGYRARLSGAADIHPLRRQADYYVVEYLWPLEGNQGVEGLEISSQPANLAALLAGRATGLPTASAPFHLFQETSDRTGFLLRYPIFRRTPGADAQSDFVGSVAAVIRTNQMLDAVRKSGFLRGLSLRLTDIGPRGSPSAKTSGAGLGEALLGLSQDPAPRATQGPRRETRILDVLDRRWRLDFVQTRALASAEERRLLWWIGLAGGALSLLLAGLTCVLCRLRLRAVSQAARTSDALQRSEERFRAVFNQAAVGVSLSDMTTGRLVRVNRKYAAMLGYSESELLQCDFQSLSHPDDLPADLAQMARVRSGEIQEFQMEKRMMHKDGHPVWVLLTVSPIRQPGAAPDYHVAVIQDVTERRRMQDALRDSERRLRGLLDHLPVGVCLVEQGQCIVFRNQQFLRICGYAEDQAPDVRSWWALVVPDPAARRDLRRAWEHQWRHAPDGGESRARLECRIRCRDGRWRTVELSGLRLGTDYLVTLEDLTVRKTAEEEIRYLAYNDPLTGLPNRRLLLDRLQQALAASARRRRYGVLLMLDLDHFKTINETRGHDAGDELLRQVADRLKKHLRDSHTIARHGDDEFVIVLEDLSDQPEEAAARAEDQGRGILQALRAPYLLNGEFCHSSVSMGASLFQGQETAADEQLRRADLAMYQAKAAGRDTLQFYDPHMQAVVHKRVALELDMRVGLDQGQFELFYQPQLDRSGIVGCEALLRWKHPRDGYVSPASFIPLAEDSGLILPLGDWVLRTACRQLAAWADRPALAGIRVAVNVSPRQFRQPDFVEQVLAALAGSGADARSLELELTEGLLLQNVEDTIEKMARLKSYGVGFSLDDFGTGYSSLAYLKRLPLDQLKIDQSFVRDVLTDPNDAAIARTIVALGLSLGLRVIAEGVETEAQRAFLQRHHCHAWQGYLFSPPVPAADLEALVEQGGAVSWATPRKGDSDTN